MIEKNILKENDIELTPEQKKKITKLSSHFDKNQKLAWNRRHKKLESLMEDLEPIEEEILELKVKKEELIDEMNSIRTEMVTNCVHPRKFVVFDFKNPNVMICKFCNGEIVVHDETED